ncbi:hypothetical protein DFQ28_005937 [Apophysomyces sp. BC1034]|nr:hypothetical protein DFQ28_005937 [Apophysomyces sp. BC1034]
MVSLNCALAKLTLHGYLDRELKRQAGGMEAMYNPETLELNYEADYRDNEAINDDSLANCFTGLQPGCLTLQLLFDGQLPGNTKPVDAQLTELRTLCGIIDGRSRETRFLQVKWGKLSWHGDGYFAGRMTSMAVRYTLFDRDGAPLRASVTLSLIEDRSIVLQKAAKGLSAPSVSTLRAPDMSSLPLIASGALATGAALGGSSVVDYLDLAYANNLDNLDDIQPGKRRAVMMEAIELEMLVGSSQKPLAHLKPVSVETYCAINRIPSARVKLAPSGDSRSDLWKHCSEDAAQCQPGAEVVLRLKSGRATVLFSGIVADSQLDVRPGAFSLSLRLVHSLYRLVNSHRNQIFEKQSDADVIRRLLSAQKIKVGTLEGMTAQQEQLIQWSCSDWQWVRSRLSAYPIWLLPKFDAVTCIKPKLAGRADHTLMASRTSATETLIEEVDWQHGGTVLPKALSVLSWDVSQQKEQTVQATKPSIGRGAFDASKAPVLNSEPWQLTYRLPLSKEEAQALADARLLALYAAAVQVSLTVTGSSESAGYALGQTLELKGFGAQFDGMGLTSEVRHHWQRGALRTTVAIGQPASHPVDAGMMPRVLGETTGVVDAYQADSGNLDRLRVKVPGFAKPLWARQGFPYASKDGGLCLYPEPGDEVVLTFLENDPRFPVVMNAMHNPKNKAPFPRTKENAKKALVLACRKPRQSLMFDDKEGSVVLENDKDRFSIHKDKGMQMHSEHDIAVDAQKINVNAKQNLTLEGKTGVSVKGAKDGVYGRGWSFPIQFETSGVKMAKDQDDIAQSLQILFSTQPGERIMRPDYGCDLQSIVFENISATLLAELQTRITDSMLRYEPRVAVEDIVINYDEPAMLRIQVAYRICGTDQVQRLSGQLDIGTGRGGYFPMFGPRQVTVSGPAMIRGSGQATVSGHRICVLGDEKKVQVQARYTTPAYPIPGSGLITIMQLLPNQQAPRCTTGAAIILKGQQFIARFTPTQPAQHPQNGPDAMAPTPGKGRFITTQDESFVLDDRLIDWHLQHWSEYCQLIPFGDPSSTHYWKEVLFPGSDPDSFKALAALAGKPDGQMRPDQAFLLAFLKLLQTPKALFNELPAQHRQLYYRQELGLCERLAAPDRVALSFKLDEDRSELMLTAGLLLDAGQDSQGAPRHYRLDRNLLANQGTWTDLRWCQPGPEHKSKIYRIVHDASAQPEKIWPTGGIRLFEYDVKQDRPVVTGRVVSSPALAVSSGQRTITITLQQEIDTPATLKAYASGDGQWIPLKQIPLEPGDDRTGNCLVFVLEAGEPAIIASPGLDGFTDKTPLLKITREDGQPLPEITQLSIQVKQSPDVLLSTDDGVSQLTERCYPFGHEPIVGSGFYLVAADWCNKPGCKITLTMTPEWLDLPDKSFVTWYQDYGTGAPLNNDDFKLKRWIDPDRTSLKKASIGPLETDSTVTLLTLDDDDQALFGGDAPPIGQSVAFSFESLNIPISESPDPRKWQQCLRLELAGHDFMHKAYWQNMTLKEPKNLNPPYTPQLKCLHVDFQLVSPVDKQYVLTPFGYGDEDGAVVSTPPEPERQLYLGFQHLEPGQDLSLHWQLQSPHRQDIHWEYLSETNHSNHWMPLDAYVHDDTDRLFRTGLWSITLPNDATDRAVAMPAGRYWIRAQFFPSTPIRLSNAAGSALTMQEEPAPEPSDYPWLYCLHTNSATATRVDVEQLALDPLPLPAGTITRTVEAVEGIQNIEQPWPSEGGQGPEREPEFLRRVPQRLNHRDRALTWRDITALLRERYPEIYGVRIASPVPADDKTPTPTQRLVIVPTPGKHDNADKLRPAFHLSRLEAMRDDLLSRASAWLSLQLCNPLYQSVNLSYTIDFHRDINSSYGYHQTQLALADHYMPWSNEAGNSPVAIGESIDYYALLAFIQQLPWVDRVRSLMLNNQAESVIASALEVLILKFPDHPTQ